MRFLLGLDQGMSKTHAVVASPDGQVLGLGRSLGGSHSITGMDHAMEMVKLAVQDALQNAGLPNSTVFDAVAAGLSGCDFACERVLLTEALSQIIPCSRIRVMNDCLPALRAGTRATCAIIVCGGTGLNCATRDPQGNEFVFGYFVPDLAHAGSSIGREAIHAVFDAFSGIGVKTSMEADVLDLLGEPDVMSLLYTYNLKPYSVDQIAPIARIVEKHALRGDSVANQILKTFAVHAAAVATAAIKRLQDQTTPPELILSGSVFKCRAPILWESFYTAINEGVQNLGLPNRISISNAKMEPILGTLVYVAEDVGMDGGEIYDRLLAQAEGLDLLRKM